MNELLRNLDAAVNRLEDALDSEKLTEGHEIAISEALTRVKRVREEALTSYTTHKI